jgi:hypothetical protein
MGIDELGNKELEKLAEAFSKSPLMIKKRKSAENFFNSPQFSEFLKQRNEQIKKGNDEELNEKSSSQSQ